MEVLRLLRDAVSMASVRGWKNHEVDLFDHTGGTRAVGTVRGDNDDNGDEGGAAYVLPSGSRAADDDGHG